jgi:hypothetical protein
MFVPRTLEPVQIDKMTVKLYPVVDSTMKPPEHTHAFQINKTALAAPGIDRRVMLDTLGAQLNLSAIVDGVLGDWTRHFQRAWCNFHHLTILSFHNDAGAQVNDTTTADSAVLLPVIDGHVADCRKKNIRFVRVQLNLDFASLVTLDPPGVTVLRVEFYIELPQSSRDLTNGSGTAYRLTTFLGPDDIRLIPAAEFSRDILAVTLQDGPIDLLRPDFNLTSAKTDSTTIAAEINSKIIRLATPSVLDHLFNQLCPGYSKEPHAALDHIKQTYDDATGNTIFSSVYEYYTRILAASRPFIDQEVLPVSVCQVFMDGLDSRLLAGFRTHFPNYSQSQDRTATHQRKVLQDMLQAAIRAETEYTNIRTIASEALGAGQAFSAQVNASQAEKTISNYKGGDDGSNKSGSTASRGPLRCYGCGGPHPWSSLDNGIYVIKCPNAGNPGIQENAKKTIERIRNKRKKKQQDYQKRKNLATTNYSDFDDTSKERIRQQVLQSVSTASEAASVSSSITGMTGGTPSASAGAGRGRGKPIIFMYDAQVLQTESNRPTLPVAIQSGMPHITLQLGPVLNDNASPSIRCVLDTAAALCTGNYHFFAAIAKRYPHCVAKIYLPEDYSPIILSGIVQDNAHSVTTDLSVAFQFHLPYLTKDGSPTSFVVATGPQVSVNTVLGLPLITATGMIIDYIDNVVEAKHLDCPPFKIEFRRATKHIPAFEDDATTHYVEFEDVHGILQKTDAYIAGLCESIQSAKSPTVSNSETHRRVEAMSDSDSMTTIKSIAGRWVPPPSANDTSDDYHDQVLGDAGYL